MIHTTDSAPAASKPILEGIAQDLGFVPNLAATIATSSTLLRGFDDLRRAVGSGQLDAISCEVAGVAVGVAVDNHYGVAFHSTVLGLLGVEDAEIERMRDGLPPLDGRLAAAYELARQIVVNRGKVTIAPSLARRKPVTASRRSSRSSPNAPSPVSSE
jgi:hypothetical protein